MGNICGGDIYAELMKKYGPEFTKLVLAEKSKEAVDEKLGQSKNEATSMFSQFETKAFQQIDAQTGQIKQGFENAKSELNTKVPGGISALEKLKGGSIDDMLGLNEIFKKVETIKTETKSSIDTQKNEAFSGLDKVKTDVHTKIDKEKPTIPFFSSLPETMQKELLARGSEEMAGQIKENNASVLGSLAPMLGLDKYKNMLEGANPANKMNELVNMANGGFKEKISSLTSMSGVGGAMKSFGFGF